MEKKNTHKKQIKVSKFAKEVSPRMHKGKGVIRIKCFVFKKHKKSVADKLPGAMKYKKLMRGFFVVFIGGEAYDTYKMERSIALKKLRHIVDKSQMSDKILYFQNVPFGSDDL